VINVVELTSWQHKVREWIVRQKIMLLYGKDWAQFVLIGFIGVDALKKYWPFSMFGIVELMIAAILGMWMLGLVLFKLGFFTSENDFRFKNSFLRKIDIDKPKEEVKS
jgi:hypothetical protein